MVRCCAIPFSITPLIPHFPHLNRLAVLRLAAGLIFCAGNASAGPGHWVTTWACAPQLTEPGNLPPVTLAHRTLRQFVRTSIPAKHLRVRLSNAYGDKPVVILSGKIAMAAGTGSAGTGEINPATDQALVFRGAPGVIIPAGETALSDPLAFDLPATADVALSLYFGDASASTVNGHPGSRTTSFIADGNAVSTADLPAATKTEHWYFINAIEVQAEATGRNVAILGDSITDGRGSTTNGNNRWADQLAKRFIANPATTTVGIANMGIGGNAIFGGLGPSAVNRFNRDILQQTGVRYLIVFEGVNDIGGVSEAGAPALATNLINAYTDFANQARAKNIKPFAATITPFGTSGYYSAAHESARQTINSWIRNNVAFDGYIDFDAAVRDPSAPVNLLPAYSSDGLHLTPQGYQAMADAVNLNFFTP